ncbi:hypothetical protein EUTSA_v10029405mg, partial [Eutrema salsugineum]
PLISLPEDLRILIYRIDASWINHRLVSGFGWSFEDGSENEIFGLQECRRSLSTLHAKMENFVKSPIVAESLTIRLALHQGKEMGIRRICLASDSKKLIQAISNHSPIREIYGILFDIHHISSFFDSVTFIFLSREKKAMPTDWLNQACVTVLWYRRRTIRFKLEMK